MSLAMTSLSFGKKDGTWTPCAVWCEVMNPEMQCLELWTLVYRVSFHQQKSQSFALQAPRIKACSAYVLLLFFSCKLVRNFHCATPSLEVSSAHLVLAVGITVTVRNRNKEICYTLKRKNGRPKLVVGSCNTKPQTVT